MARFWVLCAALLFSTGGVAIKATDLSSWQVASFRSGVAAAALMLLLPAWRRWWGPRQLAVGAAYAATLILFVVGNKLTTAANTIFLQGTAPLYVLLLAPWLLRERIRGRDLAYMSGLAAGLLLVLWGGDPAHRSAPNPALGNRVAALAGIAWALTLLGLRWLGRRPTSGGRDPAGEAVVAGNLIAFAVALPWTWPIAESSAVDWGIVAYLGLFQIGLAYVAMTRGIRGVGALELSLLLLVEPVLSALLAWASFDERPGVRALAGYGLILATTAAMTLPRRAPPGDALEPR